MKDVNMLERTRLCLLGIIASLTIVTASQATTLTTEFEEIFASCEAIVENGSVDSSTIKWIATDSQPDRDGVSFAVRLLHPNLSVVVRVSRKVFLEVNKLNLPSGDFRNCAIQQIEIPERRSSFGWKSRVDLPKIWERATEPGDQEAKAVMTDFLRSVRSDTSWIEVPRNESNPTRSIGFVRCDVTRLASLVVSVDGVGNVPDMKRWFVQLGTLSPQD